MKKILLMTAFIGFFTLVHAQTEQGGVLVGASTNLAFTSTSFDGQEDNDTNFSLEGQAGFFLVDNLNFGLLIGFSSSKDGATEISGTSTLIGPYARYYVGGQFFLGAGYGITSARAEDRDGNELFEANGGNILLEAGYPIWIVESVAIEPALSYSIGTGDFDTSSSLRFNIGFNLYFSKN